MFKNDTEKEKYSLELINLLDELSKEYDQYDYMDNSDINDKALFNLKNNISKGKLENTFQYLNEIIEESDIEYIINKAKYIKFKLLDYSKNLNLNNINKEENVKNNLSKKSYNEIINELHTWSIEDIHSYIVNEFKNSNVLIRNSLENLVAKEISIQNKNNLLRKDATIFKCPITPMEYNYILNKFELENYADFIDIEKIDLLTDAGIHGVIVEWDNNKYIGVLGTVSKDQQEQITTELTTCVGRKILESIDSAFENSTHYFLGEKVLEIFNDSLSKTDIEKTSSMSKIEKSDYFIRKYEKSNELELEGILMYDNIINCIDSWKDSILDDIRNLGVHPDFYLTREECFFIGIGEEYDHELEQELSAINEEEYDDLEL